MLPSLSSLIVSPGRPISRLTKVPPAPHFTRASGGVLKTMIWPRCGLEKSRQTRQASTRSLKPASQPGAGRAQCSVGSIDDDGIRYGLTTHAFRARTMTIAPAMVRTQSSATRTGPRQVREEAAERVSHRTCSLRQASIRAWSPERSTSGTVQPRNSAGRV